MPAERSRLTLKQKRFAEEYVATDGNATQAYFRAYGRKNRSGSRRTYKGAQGAASLLLSNPIIQAELDIVRQEYAKATRVSKLRVVREIANLAFSNQNDIFERGANGLPQARDWDEIADSTKRAIQSIKIKRRTITRNDGAEETTEEIDFKLHPKGAELDKLCKKLGFYTDSPGAIQGGTVMIVKIPDNGRDPAPEVQPDALEGEADANDQ